MASQLHVRAELTDITRPRPGETVLTELRLADLESDEFFCSTEQLQFHNANGRMVIEVGQLQLPATRLDDLWSAFSTWLATDSHSDMIVKVEKLIVSHETFPDFQLQDVVLRTEQHNNGHRLVKLVGKNSDDEKFEVAIIATDGKFEAQTTTMQVPLPAWLVGKFVPGVKGCGLAEFRGLIEVQRAQRKIIGQMQGNFTAIDLQQWIGTDGPHRLQGSATLNFEDFTWTDGRIQSANGSLHTGNGAMSYSLFENAQQLCGCVPGAAWQTPIPSPPETTIEFDELAAQFQITAGGIAVTGNGTEGALITKNQAPLTKLQQQPVLLPVGRLVRLLNQAHPPGWFPATRKAHDMADSLPLPGDE